MEDPTLAVKTDSFNNPCSAPVPLVGTSGDEPSERPGAGSWRNDVRRICERHELTVEQVEAQDQRPGTCYCRFEVFARLRARGWSTTKIAFHVGGRDHTTVIYGLKRFAALVRDGKITPLIF